VRSRFREWYPELIMATLLGLFLLIRAQDGPLFVVFCVIVLATGWALGHRHHALPLHRKIDRQTEMLREMTRQLPGSEEADKRPKLTLVRRD